MLRHLPLILLLRAASPAFSSTGTADALVLLVPGFAEQIRLGEAGWAIGGAAWGACGNPSTMTPGFSASGGRWNFSTTSAAVATAFQPVRGLAAGGFARFVGRGGLTGRDESGVETGDYSWSSGTAGASASFPLPLPGARGGVSAGVVWEKVDDASASGVTASAGLSVRPLESLEASLAVLNLGCAPSWNGITKDMPTQVSTGAGWRATPFLRLLGGASIGFRTSTRLSAAFEAEACGLSASAGWTAVPGQDEAGGFFAGLSWKFRHESLYSAEFATRQTGSLSWPVSAGISVAF